MKKIVNSLKNCLSSILLSFHYRILKTDTVLFFEPLLEKCLKRNPDFFFVQIGANDGIFCDSLFEFATKNRLRGLAVEPLNDFFEQLKKNYAPFPQVKPVRCAIHTSLKSVQIHRVDPAQQHRVGDFAKGIGSLDWAHHQRAGVPDDCMISETVPAMTLAELLKSNNVTRVDLLQIDAEGYDAEIIKMLADISIRPSIIRFEHGLANGTVMAETFSECADFLIGRGYYLIMEQDDAIAYDREIFAAKAG